jgi:hypothetical protein
MKAYLEGMGLFTAFREGKPGISAKTVPMSSFWEIEIFLGCWPLVSVSVSEISNPQYVMMEVSVRNVGSCTLNLAAREV